MYVPYTQTFHRLHIFHHTPSKNCTDSQYPYRIKYKLSLITHKTIYHNTPGYIASLIKLSIPPITLQTRSNNSFLLQTSYYIKFNHIVYVPSHHVISITGSHTQNTYVLYHQHPYLKSTLNVLLPTCLPLINNTRPADC